MKLDEVFKDLTIVELASVLAGPSVGMFFAELGATVIKIENSDFGGDVTRSWKLPGESGKTSAYFSAVNYRKQYKNLNLKNPSHREELNALLAKADILLTNFKHGGAEKFNLSFEQIHSSFPNLIVGQISGFKSIPNRTAYDVVVQAETGFMFMNGTPDANPVKMPVALMDILAAHQLKEGLLVALLKRAKTGKGYFVKTNLEQAGISSLANQASNFLMQNFIPQPIGSQHPNIAPYGDTFTCADKKQIVLAIGSNTQFEKLLQALKVKPASPLHKLDTNQKRLESRKALVQNLSPFFLQQNRDEILNQLIKMQVPAGAVRPMNEVFENPAAIALIREEVIENQLTKRVSSIAFEISED